jgi:hypothetical protein
MKEKEYRLPKKFAEKWVTVLRSGKYTQTEGILYDPEEKSFCCLGVACAMNYPLHRLKNKYGNFATVIDKTSEDLQVDFKKIPKELKGPATKNALVAELTEINDNGYSFDTIADWLEKNVEFYE